MSIDRLRYFAAVVETKNLRKAAEIVGIAPPSMSKAMAVLESEMGFKLIHQDGRGIGITDRGLEVYRNLKPLLIEYQRFHQASKDGGKTARKLRIATFEVFSTYFLSSFLLQERKLDALVLEMTPGKIEQAVLEGTVDVGLTYLAAPDPALEFVEIGSFEMGVYGRKEWASTPFDEWPFAVPTTELRVHTSDMDSLDMWPRNGPKRFIKYEFDLLETALQTSRNGLSVLHCPAFIVALHNEVTKSAYQLTSLEPPKSYKKQSRVKCFVFWRRSGLAAESSLGGKLAKFMRSLD